MSYLGHREKNSDENNTVVATADSNKLLLLFAELQGRELHRATLGCLELGTYQQLNLSCVNDSLIYVIDVRHSYANQSQTATAAPVTCTPDMTSSLGDDEVSWCVDGPPYNEMAIDLEEDFSGGVQV